MFIARVMNIGFGTSLEAIRVSYMADAAGVWLCPWRGEAGCGMEKAFVEFRLPEASTPYFVGDEKTFEVRVCCGTEVQCCDYNVRCDVVVTPGSRDPDPAPEECRADSSLHVVR